jgi:hypothetical protein
MSTENQPVVVLSEYTTFAWIQPTGGSGVTLAQTDALYLKKTVADTATAIETFNAGIKTQKVDGLLTSSIMYVGNNITTGSLILGNIPIRTKNQGIFETASIRAPATNGTIAICTDATIGGGVDIGTASSTTNVYGTLNVPTSGGASTNAVNVSYLTSALANTATLNQVQTFTQTNTFSNATAGIKANSIQGIATTGDQSFFTTKTAGNLNVFASSGSTAVLNVKGSGIKFDTLSTDNPTSTQGIFTNKTAGTLSIATAQTSGSINIGANGSATTVNGSLNVLNNLTSNYIAVTSNPPDSTTALQFQRNGQFTMGVAPTANPKLVMGVNTGSSPGTEVQILSLGTGTVYSNGGTLTNTNPSDETLKKNIISLDASIDDLNPVQYEWNNPKMGVGIKYGFLANEVIEIFPDICSSWKTDEEDEEDGIPKVKLGMDTVSLIPIIVSAMKKMKLDYDSKLSKLEARLLALETKSL